MCSWRGVPAFALKYVKLVSGRFMYESLPGFTSGVGGVGRKWGSHFVCITREDSRRIRRAVFRCDGSVVLAGFFRREEGQCVW